MNGASVRSDIGNTAEIHNLMFLLSKAFDNALWELMVAG
jgi:hypothetical protein